jgi:hypothetical protein
MNHFHLYRYSLIAGYIASAGIPVHTIPIAKFGKQQQKKDYHSTCNDQYPFVLSIHNNTPAEIFTFICHDK